jgi:adenylate kinase
MIAAMIGPPGSGKGTQSALITRDFGLAHVSTGDMLRAEVRAGGALGNEVAPLMAAGRLVPDELVTRIVEAWMRRADVRHGLVFDGFPRTVMQAEALDAILVSVGRRVDLVISLSVPLTDLVGRLLGRACEGRPDDSVEVIAQRMHEYQLKTTPVLDHFRAGGTPMAVVDGQGPIALVRRRISAELSAVMDSGRQSRSSSPARIAATTAVVRSG